MMILRFLGFSGLGFPLKLLVLNTKQLKICNGAERLFRGHAIEGRQHTGEFCQIS